MGRKVGVDDSLVYFSLNAQEDYLVQNPKG
jgi:hypothetical protein